MKARKGIIAVASTETFSMMVLSSNSEVLGFMVCSKDIILQLKCFPYFFQCKCHGKRGRKLKNIFLDLYVCNSGPTGNLIDVSLGKGGKGG